jgi:hypothetical protein
MINVMTRLLGVFLFFASLGIAGHAQTSTANCAAIASGGAISSISVGGTPYCVHTFTTTGAQSFSVIDPNVLSSAPLSLEYLVVGGGGGGDAGQCGAYWGSGGGGGQVLEGTVSISNTSPVSVVVGAGGTQGGNLNCSLIQFGGQPGAGGTSAFGAITANGGGAAVHGGTSPRGGHSGNGLYLGSPAKTVFPRGGAGAGNGAATPDNLRGGDGSPSSITGTATFYGGGGGTTITNSLNLGGKGGGGSGGVNGTAGTPNTGGGGGGTGTTAPIGRSGGSGIVIVRYAYVDGVRPVPILSNQPTSFNGTAPFTVTATFSENVTDFTAADVTATNASVAVSGGPSVYTYNRHADGNWQCDLVFAPERCCGRRKSWQRCLEYGDHHQSDRSCHE